MNRYDLAAILTINDLDDGKWHRLSAAEQRALWGFPVCGRKEFRVSTVNQGSIRLVKSVPPGDTIFADYTLAEMATAINTRTKLGPF